MAPADPDDGPGGFVGHDQIPDPEDPTSRGGANTHLDPGETWNWGRFEGYLRRFDSKPGECVVAEEEIAVHEAPGEAVRERAPTETAGTVVGSAEVDGARWYEVEWADGTSGWSRADAVLFARFRPGQSVRATDSLAVRAAQGATAPEREVAPEGTAGEVLDGPVDADGFRWWKVEFDGVEAGWSAGWWLRD